MVRLLLVLPPAALAALLVELSRSTLILILLPCNLNCLSSSLMNSRSSAGKLLKLASASAVRAGALVVVVANVVALLAILTRGLLGFVVVARVAAVLGVLVGRFFRVVTFLG